MKVINTYKEALEICQKYLPNKPDVHEKLALLVSPYKISSGRGPWEQSPAALELTLHYLMEYLYHACYLLCSTGNPTENLLIKIEPIGTPGFLIQVIQEEKRQFYKKHLTVKQKNQLWQFLQPSDSLRILQCILKKRRNDATTSREYERFVAGIPLPMGVYVLNLTDANLLTKNRTNPFPIFRGHPPALPPLFRSTHNKFLPIFSLSGNRAYEDIVIPNYDDVMYILGMAKYSIRDFTTNWTQKNIPKAVFRGGPSGCGYTTETNPRIRLASMPLSTHTFDVGIVSEHNSINSQSIRFDPKYGLGMMNTPLRPVARLTYAEQSKYKYIIHVDGNVNAYRLLTLLATGSLVLRVESPYTSWVDGMLVEGREYLSIRADLSDLVEKVAWCQAHDRECAEIAQRGCKFAQSFLLHPIAVKGAFQQLVMASRPPRKYTPNTPSFSPPGAPKRHTSPKTPPLPIKACPPPYLPPPPIPPPPLIKYPARTPSGTPPPDSEGYWMGEREKKCRKGFTRDKKNKKRCIKTRKSPSPSTKSIAPVAVVAVVPVAPVAPVAPIVSYFLTEKEKKCRKGFIRDKHEKTKCIEKQKS